MPRGYKRRRADPMYSKSVVYTRRGDATYAKYGPSYSTVYRKAARGDADAAIQLKNRRDDKFYGKGLYKGQGGYWGRLLGGVIGMPDLGDKIGDFVGAGVRKFGGPVGGHAMDALTSAGKGLQAAGIGQYTVEANHIVKGASTAFQAPRFAQHGTDIVVSHCEYLGDLYAPAAGSAFENQQFHLNPGLESTFPWLSQLAANYEEYQLAQCIVSFKSTIEAKSTDNGQVGQVIMATQYNPSSRPFHDKMEMMQYDGAASSSTTNNMLQGVECDPKQNAGAPVKYIRSAPLRDDQDAKEYDHAVLNVATTDIPSGFANLSMGELWISYTVLLRKPKLVVNRGLNIQRDIFLPKQAFLPYTSITGSTASGIAAPMGSSNWMRGLNSLGTQLTYAGFKVVNIQGTNIACGLSRITFPAMYSGNVKLIYRAKNDYLGDSLDISLDPWTVNGNVQRIADIPTFPQGLTDGASLTDNIQWVSSFVGGTNTGYPEGAKQTTMELHLRVGGATGGEDNYVEFFLPVSDLTFVSGKVNTPTLEISEYNVGMNERRDGTNDALQLYDVSTGSKLTLG